MHTYPSQCGSQLSIVKKIASGMASSSLQSWNRISTFGLTRGRFVGILMYQSMLALLHPGKFTTFGNLGIKCFKLSLDTSIELPTSSSCSTSPSSVMFLAKHVTGHFRLLIIVAPCWMEASCLPTVLSMLKDIPHWWPFVRFHHLWCSPDAQRSAHCYTLPFGC